MFAPTSIRRTTSASPRSISRWARVMVVLTMTPLFSARKKQGRAPLQHSYRSMASDNGNEDTNTGVLGPKKIAWQGYSIPWTRIVREIASVDRACTTSRSDRHHSDPRAMRCSRVRSGADASGVQWQDVSQPERPILQRSRHHRRTPPSHDYPIGESQSRVNWKKSSRPLERVAVPSPRTESTASAGPQADLPDAQVRLPEPPKQ